MLIEKKNGCDHWIDGLMLSTTSRSSDVRSVSAATALTLPFIAVELFIEIILQLLSA